MAVCWFRCFSLTSGRRLRLRVSPRRRYSRSCCRSWPARLRVLRASTSWHRRPPSTRPPWARSRCQVRMGRGLNLVTDVFWSCSNRPILMFLKVIFWTLGFYCSVSSLVISGRCYFSARLSQSQSSRAENRLHVCGLCPLIYFRVSVTLAARWALLCRQFLLDVQETFELWGETKHPKVSLISLFTETQERTFLRLELQNKYIH